MKDEIKVHVLRTGTLQGDLAWLLLKPGRTLMDRHSISQPRTWAQIPTHAVLIEHPEGRILWDTGVPRNWEQQWGTSGFQDMFPVLEDPQSSVGWLDSGLSSLELKTDDIDLLILSHLHYDHVGNARMFDNGKTRLIAHSNELEGVKSLNGKDAGAHLFSEFSELNIAPISGDTEIVPGVSVIETPGHTWGTMSLRIDLPNDGTKIFTSDAIYLEESYGPPAAGAAIVWDNLQWLESVEKIRKISRASNAEVIFGHDEHQVERIRWAPDSYYT